MPREYDADALSPHVPEAEALEQHADALAPLGHAIEPAVEVEVLEGRQVAVEERLVAEEADAGAVCLDLELAAARAREPGDRAAAGWSCRSRSAR